MKKNIQNLHSLLSGPFMVSDGFVTEYSQLLSEMINGNKTMDIKPTLNHTVVRYQSSTDFAVGANILEIKFHAPVVKYSQMCGPIGTQEIIQVLESYKYDNSVDAVFFDIFSGGGQVSGTPEFAEYVNLYPKPIGGYTNDTIGSAAYYFISGADFIKANKYADGIGSIGAMFQYAKLKDKNIEIKSVYADQSFDKNNISRALDEGDEQLLKDELLNPIAQQFIDDVTKYRPNIKKEALTGKVYKPEIALELGLIDSIGTKSEAIDELIALIPQSENQNQNTEMAKSSDYPLLSAVLGVEKITLSRGFLAAGTPTANLTEENLAALEKGLKSATDTNQVDTLETKLEDLRAEKTTVENSLIAIEGEIEKSVQITEATGKNSVEKLQSVNAVIEKWAEQPGASHTDIVSDGDRHDDVQDYINPEASHNKLMNELKDIESDE